MPDQLSFATIPPEVPKTNRLFFATFPDTPTATEVISPLAHQLRSRHSLRGRPLAPDRFHITLQHLDDFAEVPPPIVEAAIQAAASIVLPPFEVIFDRVESFRKSSNHPFVLRGGEDGLAALRSLQKALARALTQNGLGHYIRASFTPHVTLLYDAQLVPEQSIEPVRWTVRDFTLVHSLLGQTRHIPLAQWPLRQ